MDDNARNAASYQLDQEILDARGINMTVEDVAGLSTCKYSERVQSLKLSHEDLMFLKGLRRRIKNRLASQNSRRRSVEHLRRLARELRAVKACQRDAVAERRQLLNTRDQVRGRCASLRRHLVQILDERSDSTEVPSIEIPESYPKEYIINRPTPLSKTIKPEHISVIVKNDTNKERNRLEPEVYEKVKKQQKDKKKETIIIKEERDFEDNTIVIKEEVPDYREINEYTENPVYNEYASVSDYSESFDESRRSFDDSRRSFDESRRSFDESQRSFDENRKSFHECRSFDRNLENFELSKDIFECKISKLVHQSVNHMFHNKSNDKKVFAKTVFISNEKYSSDIQSLVLDGGENGGVLNLSVKEGRRKSHGRKQSAPRRIACYNDCDDAVLDLKIKK